MRSRRAPATSSAAAARWRSAPRSPAARRGRFSRRRCARSTPSCRAWMAARRHDGPRRRRRQPARRLCRRLAGRRRASSSARISTPCRTPARSTACSASCWASRWSSSLGGRRLPFAIEVVGFSDEEGVRFGVPFIGSRALAGTLDDDAAGRARRATAARVARRDSRASVSIPSQLGDAARRRDALGYLEFHIEQGPVLDSARPAARRRRRDRRTEPRST